MTERFDADVVRQAAAPRPTRFYKQIESTNDEGLLWLSEGVAEGAILVADEQTKGRGRLGRSWYAPPGTALMVTYLLRPAMGDLPRVGMLGALAVCETLEQLGIASAGIKWPNDVQIAGKKVCGVLPEARWDGGRLAGVALGIGLNVRIDFAATPFAETAVSIETALGRSVTRAEVLTALLARLDSWRARLGEPALFDTWRSRLNMLGKPVSVLNGVTPVSGIAEAVEADGTLLIRSADGTLERVLAGDIAMR